ncbi:thermonuclease family protein [Bdellovibrio svalbardensis]|uniref:Thermonuclease family protein n=1 Tax=Bdellovibrio svalbardensis TaxID=2972972 RepID=A0ABT6DEQ2_9BACT|nr:thermonuclease family protein [Bdellovibrio svalbardensis]MDG0814967.1 thermonuclease family protein [Bdellovibrio svalbardensis]
MNKFAALFFSTLIAFTPISFARKKKPAEVFKISGQVERCHDGDTCRVQYGNKSLKIRFAGIDCPELSQKFGKDAKHFTEALLKGHKVDLECDGKSYDRLTCTVFLNGRNINQEIVKNGWAYDSTKYSHGRYIAAVSEAKRTRMGIWKDQNLMSPYCYRHKTNKKCQSDQSYMP